ncbi:citrate-binding protein-like [Diospyros lotus]|uniref:citrate-binding protein-like n=1 Tax=Diospyros lotus TaxID=55363 RepID=UPI002253F571|nr:citrate-binding protein-like [Diospyros lotus]
MKHKRREMSGSVSWVFRYMGLLLLLLLLPPLQLNIVHHEMQLAAAAVMDLTEGFVAVPLNPGLNMEIQKPYNIAAEDRYSFKDGIHKLWVFSTDKPHTTSSKTEPRTEIRIKGYDYSSGVWQLEGQGYVPSGTSGVCIMQVFGPANYHSTALMLRVYNGSLSYYRNPVLDENMYDKWFRLNVIHDVAARKVKVYIDGVLKLEDSVIIEPRSSHYFKLGVYAQNDCSYRMESRWKDIKVLKKRV